MTLFVNGGLHHNQGNNAPWDASGHPVLLGRGLAANVPTGQLAGQVAEVRIYDRALTYNTTLAAGEVSDIYNNSLAESPTGLWHLDGNGTDAISGRSLSTGMDVSYVAGQVGTALHLAGTDQGYAATAAAAVTANGSFTISTWVNLDNADDGYTILSQNADTGPGIALRYDADFDRWVFGMTGLTADGAAEQSVAVAAHHRVGVWVHLTAMYDAFAHMLWLYSADPGFGVQAGHVRLGVPAAGSGPLQVGREISTDPDTGANIYVGTLPGSVDEIAVSAGTLPAGRIS
jgi:hypothetical protein